MNIYCPLYNHFKDVVVCKFSCPRERKCKAFEEKYQTQGREIRWELLKYMKKYPDKNYQIYLIPKKGRKPAMKQFICIKDDHIEILNEEQITEKTKNGEFYKSYFEVGREMELMIKLVAKKTDTPAKKKTAKTQ